MTTNLCNILLEVHITTIRIFSDHVVGIEIMLVNKNYISIFMIYVTMLHNAQLVI